MVDNFMELPLYARASEASERLRNICISSCLKIHLHTYTINAVVLAL